MELLNTIFILFALCSVVTISRRSNEPVTLPKSKKDMRETVDDYDCGLSAASHCLYPLLGLFNCSVATFTFDLTCNDYLLTPEKLDTLCPLADDVLNGCLAEILENSCAKSDPKHSYFKEWLKPINTLLQNLCTTDSKLAITESLGCQEEALFICLFSTHKVDLIELLTSQMAPDVCGNIEFRAQYCLTTFPLPIQCKSFMKFVKDLIQKFVDSTTCNSQPVILVPYNQAPSKPVSPASTSDEFDDDGDNDRVCDLDPVVISNCFEPMINDWKCYFNSENGCNFKLESLCSSSMEGFDSCAMDLLGYGCEGDSEHMFFNEWLDAFHGIYQELCGKTDTKISFTELQKQYFSGRVKSWVEFFNCMHSVQNEQQFVGLITQKLTHNVCRQLGDNVDYCLMVISFSEGSSDDGAFRKIQAMKNAFMEYPTCDNCSEPTNQSPNSLQKTTKYLLLFEFVYVMTKTIFSY